MSRLNEQQVNQQLEQELLSFYNTVYTRPVPKGFIQLFKDAVFHSAPISHQIFIRKIREIVLKQEGELLTGEVGIITNVINSAPLDWLYADFELAMDTHAEIEKLTIDYNSDVMAFKKSIRNKKKHVNAINFP